MVRGRFMRWGVMALIAAAMTVQLPASKAGDGARAVVPPDVVAVNAKTLQQMVDGELARQLPGAVEREWQQQLLALANERAKQEESQRRAAAQQVAMQRQAMQQSLDEIRVKIDQFKRQNGVVKGADGKAGGQ